MRREIVVLERTGSSNVRVRRREAGAHAGEEPTSMRGAGLRRETLIQTTRVSVCGHVSAGARAVRVTRVRV